MRKLFVGNLPFQATEAELEEWFARAGITVEAIAIIHDRFSGQPRGFGFIEVATESEANRVVSTCNGREFQGRTILIDHVRPLEEKPRGRSRQR